MKINNAILVAISYIGAVAAINSLLLSKSIAQEPSKIPFSFEMNVEVRDPSTRPLVFVNGELAGTVNGYIAIPTDEEAVIEIGIPSARRPLYSFIIGSEEIEAGNVDFVFSEYVIRSAEMELWDGVTVEPNQLG